MDSKKFYCMRYYITFRCNSKCRYCNVWQENTFRRIEGLPPDSAKKLIQQCYDEGVRYIDFTGGEPSLYRNLADVITFAKTLGIKTEVTTNGLGKNDEAYWEIAKCADKLNVSIDTMSRERYKEIRGVDGLESAKERLRVLKMVRKESGLSDIKIMVCVSEENVDEMEEMIRFAQKENAEIYLNPVFPYFGEQSGGKNELYIEKIVNQIYSSNTVVLMHFMEFYLDGEARKGVSCSANQQSLTFAPDGSLMMPCYHAVSEWIPWEHSVSNMLNTSVFKEYASGKRKINCCDTCTVVPYFGISFNYKLNKYFLLQSYSEKLHHLKRDYLNHFPDLAYDTDKLRKKLAELLKIVRSIHLMKEPGSDQLYWAEQRGDIYITEIYRNPVAQSRYTEDQKAEDCWALKNVPHTFYDKIVRGVYREAFKRNDEKAKDIFQDAMEFQLRWWIYYISKYMKAEVIGNIAEEEQWIRAYLDKCCEDKNYFLG